MAGVYDAFAVEPPDPAGPGVDMAHPPDAKCSPSEPYGICPPRHSCCPYQWWGDDDDDGWCAPSADGCPLV